MGYTEMYRASRTGGQITAACNGGSWRLHHSQVEYPVVDVFFFEHRPKQFASILEVALRVVHRRGWDHLAPHLPEATQASWLRGQGFLGAIQEHPRLKLRQLVRWNLNQIHLSPKQTAVGQIMDKRSGVRAGPRLFASLDVEVLA